MIGKKILEKMTKKIRKPKPSELVTAKTMGYPNVNWKDLEKIKNDIYKEAVSDILHEIRTEIETLNKKAEKSQTYGLIVGSLMTLIGGVFTGSLLWFTQNKNDASTFLVVFSSVMFL